MDEPLYSHVEVDLSGEDGNGFFMISRTREAMRRAGVDQSAIEKFSEEAISGNYDHLIQTIFKYVSVN